MLKFEGIQSDGHLSNNKNIDKDQKQQIEESLRRLAIYCHNTSIPKSCDNWSDFFSRLKTFWDDRLRHIKRLRLVICGSSPSFIINSILSDSAFYNRSTHQICLEPFGLDDVKEFLEINIGAKEAMVAALTVGGVCEYLKIVKNQTTSTVHELAV